MKKNLFPLLLILVSLSSCFTKDEGSKDGKVYFNDYENILPWNEASNNVQTIIKGQGHSGNYLCKVDTTLAFGYLFKAKLNQLSDKKVKKVKTSVWVNVKSLNAKGSVVIALDSAGKVFHWQGLPIEKEMKAPNEWVNLKVEVDLDALKLSDKPWLTLGTYVWNQGKEQILSDDLEVTIID